MWRRRRLHNETRFQVSLKMSISAERKVAMDKALCAEGKACRTAEEIWEQVLLETGRHAPKLQGELPDLKRYLLHQAGNDGCLSKEIVAFQRSLKKPKIVRGSVLAAIAELTLGDDGHGCIAFRQDIIKACISASPRYSHGEEQTLFEASFLRSAQRLSLIHI